MYFMLKMEENKEDPAGLKLVIPLKNLCLFTYQMQCSQNKTTAVCMSLRLPMLG